MKTFYKLGKIFGAIIIIALIFVLVVSVIEMPVAEEGEELSVAQQWLVAVKTNINTITTSLNITTGAILTILLATYKKVTEKDTAEVGGKIDGIKALIEKLTAEKDRQEQKDATQNNAIGALMDLYIASDLPASARLPLQEAREKLKNGADGSFDELVKAVADKLPKVDKIPEPSETAENGANKGEKQEQTEKPKINLI